jgi:hypothetical protein
MRDKSFLSSTLFHLGQMAFNAVGMMLGLKWHAMGHSPWQLNFSWLQKSANIRSRSSQLNFKSMVSTLLNEVKRLFRGQLVEALHGEVSLANRLPAGGIFSPAKLLLEVKVLSLSLADTFSVAICSHYKTPCRPNLYLTCQHRTITVLRVPTPTSRPRYCTIDEEMSTPSPSSEHDFVAPQ